MILHLHLAHFFVFPRGGGVDFEFSPDGDGSVFEDGSLVIAVSTISTVSKRRKEKEKGEKALTDHTPSSTPLEHPPSF